MHALCLKHRSQPGRRQELKEVWRQHMMPAIDADRAHLAYIYSDGDDPDTIGVALLLPPPLRCVLTQYGSSNLSRYLFRYTKRSATSHE